MADGQRAVARQVLEPATANPWRTLEERVAYEGRGLRVRRDRVVAPDGREGDYEFVEAQSNFAVVVPVDAYGNVTLVRQWRYPWGAGSWEAPAGHLEPGETPLDAAQRELREEAGLEAADWRSLATLRASASFTVQGHVFLAQSLTPVPHAREGSEGDMIVRRLPLADALAAVAAGEIVHAVTISALFLAARDLTPYPLPRGEGGEWQAP